MYGSILKAGTVAPVAVVSLSLLGGLLAVLRRRRRRVTGLALGVFDFCHEGHVNLLRRAAARCDRLVVGVHTDAAVRDYKGTQPANSALERAAAVRALGFAHKVVIESDRERLCRREHVNRVFHGDEWDPEAYRNHWGAELVDALGVELMMLPHTPGICSTQLREQVPPLGWWLYSPNETWDRSHIFSHLAELYAQLGGVWFVSEGGRRVVRERFSDAPCALLPGDQGAAEAAAAVEHYGLRAVITAHFNYGAMLKVLGGLPQPMDLVVLSHGRSGKLGASAGARALAAADSAPDPDVPGGRRWRDGTLTVHDWSFADDTYLHLDGFLSGGGRLRNPVPAGRPRLLLLPTWGPEPEKRGLLTSKRWRLALKDLGADVELLLSPHPLLEKDLVTRFVQETGATVLPPHGDSFRHVSDVHVTLSDLSGVFWEALLFDTPALLARAAVETEWPADLPPRPEDLERVVPCIAPEDLAARFAERTARRCPEQRRLAEARLGPVDGQATARLVTRLRAFLAD
jgi:glycerol-3-phosphate cytidylyltransferase